ncbi:MAG TPA: amidohydrolase family protein [Devosia sp.]|nr:amidohydrolase family protein [Devosia sp.]
MIIDCHAHVFQNWVGNSGHTSSALHKKYLQRMLVGTAAKTFRRSDGAPADTEALIRSGETTWEHLNDVALRVGRFGQIEFTVEGEDYYAQYMPVGMQNIESPPEFMIAQMDYAGIDHAVLQAGGAYGAMTRYNHFAQQQNPERFTGLIHLDEALAGSPESLAEIKAFAAAGMKGVYFNANAFARHSFDGPLDHPSMLPFFSKLNELGLVLCIECSGQGGTEAEYVGNLRALARLLEQFPAIGVQVAMGPPVSFFAKDGQWNFPSDVLALFRRDNFYLEIMYPITWGGLWDYPYVESRPLIENLRNQVGAERLLWGSDMPNVERYCTYPQSLEYLRRYCTFLTATELDQILGLNAARLYNIPTLGR